MALKASELRIGNYIEFHAIGIREGGIDVLDIRDIAEGRVIIPPKPIPLTEEWFNKLGLSLESREKNICFLFKHYGENILGSELNLRHCNGERYGAQGDNYWSLWFGDTPLEVVRITYVHQIQNLYYALTGEELQAK